MFFSHKILLKWGVEIDIVNDNMNLKCNQVLIIELMVPELWRLRGICLDTRQGMGH